MTKDISAHWIESIGLPAHADLLARLVTAARSVPEVRYVELGCSVARGAGDQYSDLDLAVGIADDSWPHALSSVSSVLTGLQPVADVLEHELNELGGLPHRRFFVQYRDGLQVDLVAFPASTRRGLPPGNVALHDADCRLTDAVTPASRTATADQVREWAFLAWIAMADLDKYLRRRSPWEAHQRLDLARDYAWRLAAVAADVPYPVFGLSSVLDETEPPIPEGMNDTMAGLDLDSLRAAGAVLADVIQGVAAGAAAATGADLPRGMADFVRLRLDALRAERG